MSSLELPPDDILPVPCGSAAPGYINAVPNLNPERIKRLLENPGCVLHCFGRSDIKLNREMNRLSYVLNNDYNPLTTDMEADMTEWNRQTDIAKTTRRRVNLYGMDFDGILEGAVILKRYTLYLINQSCELMPKP